MIDTHSQLNCNFTSSKVNSRQIISHFVRSIANIIRVALTQLSFIISTPALGTPVVEQSTSMIGASD
jgi:hypothetical protein